MVNKGNCPLSSYSKARYIFKGDILYEILTKHFIPLTFPLLCIWHSFSRYGRVVLFDTSQVVLEPQLRQLALI